MRILILLPLCLTACSGDDTTTARNAVDLNGAALRGQSDIDNYADLVGPSRPHALARPTPVAVPAVEQGSPAAAAAIVHDYFDAIAAHDYRAAQGLCRQDTTPPMDAQALAHSYAGYATVLAAIGAPTDQDAGAGQVYITVPVTVTGRTRDGGGYRLSGPIILHRVNDGIDTASPQDHAWRIERSELKPQRSPYPGETS